MNDSYDRKRGKKKTSYRLTVLYHIFIVLFTAFVLLDTFVIPHAEASEESSAESADSSTSEANSVEAEAISDDSADSSSTGDSAEENAVSITLETDRVNDTTIYVAHIYTSDITQILTALAENTYGRNIKETTSDMAEENNAILAINGDYYGARNSGYVIRNGVLYRSRSASSDQEDLVIWSDGTFEIITEGQTSAEALLEEGVHGTAWQVFSFGPGLIIDGEIAVTTDDEVDQAMTSNPRTAIAQIDEEHYVFVVADGRTDESEGLSLYELASYLKSLGAVTAYNLDGGGSSTMVFAGEVINTPTTSGNSVKERKVSDIVYIQSTDE